MRYRYLSIEELKEIHRKIIEETGGSLGILFPGNLEICVEVVKHKIFGLNPYKDIIEKAASLLYNIVKLHPFLDGNKRTAIVATAVFLDLNGFEMLIEPKEAISFLLKLSKCSIDYENTIKWLERRVNIK